MLTVFSIELHCNIFKQLLQTWKLSCFKFSSYVRQKTTAFGFELTWGWVNNENFCFFLSVRYDCKAPTVPRNNWKLLRVPPANLMTQQQRLWILGWGEWISCTCGCEAPRVVIRPSLWGKSRGQFWKAWTRWKGTQRFRIKRLGSSLCLCLY